MKITNRRQTIQVTITAERWNAELKRATNRNHLMSANTDEQWAKQQILTLAGRIVEARKIKLTMPYIEITEAEIQTEWENHCAVMAILDGGYARPFEMIQRYCGNLGTICPSWVSATGDAAKMVAGIPSAEFSEQCRKQHREDYEFSIRAENWESPDFVVEEIKSNVENQ